MHPLIIHAASHGLSQVLLLLLGPIISNHMPHIMAVLAAALRDAMSQALKMQALCAWRVFVGALASCGAGKQQQGEEPLLGRVAQQAVVVLMEALEEGVRIRHICECGWEGATVVLRVVFW